MKENKRSIETAALGAALKYGGKFGYRFFPHIKIIFGLICVRLGFKRDVTFKYKYMLWASKWADRVGLRKNYQYTYSFPTGLMMHRAVGVPEYDNYQAITIMVFKKKMDKVIVGDDEG
jgi:hypothetical protein